MIIEYIGLAEAVDDGYTVFFPDFPGFGSAGDTFEEARKNAKEGLIGHIELMVEDGEKLPTPSRLNEIVQLPDAEGCVALIVSIIAPSGKAERINITMDTELLNAIDLLAHEQHTSRSAVLAEGAQRLLSDIQDSTFKEVQNTRHL